MRRFFRRVGRHIPLFFILAGCGLLLYVAGTQFYTAHQQNEFVRAYQRGELTVPLIIDDEEAADDAATGQEEGLPDTGAVLRQQDAGAKHELQLVGILRLPKIDLSVAIGAGISGRTLHYTVGHYNDSALPGDVGNCSIVGHRSYMRGQFFNRLDEMDIGDDIYADRDGQTYRYVVTEKFVVEPQDTWVLNTTSDAQITLITCTPIRVATHRLIIKSVLAE